MWGLDDYQFLPFVWGAAQLVGHPHIRPRSIHSHEVLEACSADFLYLAAVRFVRQARARAGRCMGTRHRLASLALPASSCSLHACAPLAQW